MVPPILWQYCTGLCGVSRSVCEGFEAEDTEEEEEEGEVHVVAHASLGVGWGNISAPHRFKKKPHGFD